MIDTIICVVCPVSCPVEVEWDEGGVIRADHAQCKLAADYVRSEIFDPRRTVTTSVSVTDGALPLVSAKTDRPVPKAVVLEAMDALAGLQVPAPVRIGDVLVEDLLGTGSNLVATRDVARPGARDTARNTGGF